MAQDVRVKMLMQFVMKAFENAINSETPQVLSELSADELGKMRRSIESFCFDEMKRRHIKPPEKGEFDLKVAAMTASICMTIVYAASLELDPMEVVVNMETLIDQVVRVVYQHEDGTFSKQKSQKLPGVNGDS